MKLLTRTDGLQGKNIITGG